MGRPTSKLCPEHPLRRMRPRHRMMMYYLIAGHTQIEISEKLNITQARLSVIVNSPLFKAELSKLEGDIYKKAIEKKSDIATRIMTMEPEALDTIHGLMVDKRSGGILKRSCAKDILELGQKERIAAKEDSAVNAADLISEAFKLAKGRYEERKRQQQQQQATAIDLEKSSSPNSSPPNSNPPNSHNGLNGNGHNLVIDIDVDAETKIDTNIDTNLKDLPETEKEDKLAIIVGSQR